MPRAETARVDLEPRGRPRAEILENHRVKENGIVFVTWKSQQRRDAGSRAVFVALNCRVTR